MKHTRQRWLAGTAVVALTLVALGFAAPRVTRPGIHGESQAGSPEVPFPHPRDIVRIIEGQDYVVPAGKILTMREFVASGTNSNDAVLKINGRSTFLARVDFGAIAELQLGIVATAGQVVTLEPSFPMQGVVGIGFLVDA